MKRKMSCNFQEFHTHMEIHLYMRVFIQRQMFLYLCFIINKRLFVGFFFFKMYLFWSQVEQERERERQKYLPFVNLFPRWLQWWWLMKATTRSQGFIPGSPVEYLCSKHWNPGTSFLCRFPRPFAVSSIRSGATEMSAPKEVA